MEPLGLTDEELWKINPRLVICHVSGFGQSGLPEYVSRPSTDPTAQAFAGWMHANRNPLMPPYGVGPYAGDYITGLFATLGMLMALRRVSQTGRGESVDVSQVECLLKTMQQLPDWFSENRETFFTGYPVQYAAIGTYTCADGEFLTMVLGGIPSFRKAIPFFGLAYGSELFPEGIGQVFRGTPAGAVLGEAVQKYMQSHTADEAEAEITAIGLMAQKVYTPSDIRVHPHLAARGIFEQITTRKGIDLTYVGGVPRFTQDPASTWRAAPWWGMDNEAILAGLGYDEAAIQDLYHDAIVTHDPEMKFSYPY